MQQLEIFFEGAKLAKVLYCFFHCDHSQGTSYLSDYRPISLCNFVYKILSKIMVSRLGTMLTTLISDEQSAFVKGRRLCDNILLAQELVHDIGR